MRLLPSESCVISVATPLHTVVERLQSLVEPKKWFRFSRKHRPFEGTVGETGFSIQRIIHYRNSFLPQIVGSLEPQAGGTLVTLRFCLHPMVLAFMVVWFGFAGLLGLAVAVAAIGDVKAGWFVLFPLAFLLFGYALMMACFLSEVSEARRLLVAALGDSESARETQRGRE